MTGFGKMAFLEEETILVGVLYMVAMNLTLFGVEQSLRVNS
jgi:hypothetical protein